MAISTARRESVERWVPRGRKLHLIDVENLCGGSVVEPDAVRERIGEYVSLVGRAAADHIVIACSPQLLLPCKMVRPDARVLLGYGRDGAEIAILRDCDVADIARRYEEVVVGSGDHAFMELAASLRLHGVDVTVVSRPSALAYGLSRVASHIYYLSELPDACDEVAIGRAA